jgi:wobble nucleotide-excising tRNase
MIKKININNLGIFKLFNWDSIKDHGDNVVLLKRENIFYGRNYSGKTTLSRIIRALETKELSSKYIDPEFEIILEDNSIINQTNFEINSLDIRCFNEDFIRENLSFTINPNSDIRPFAILGENNDIEKKIESIKNELGDNLEDSKTLKYKDLKDLDNEVNQIKNYLSDLKISLDNQIIAKATGGSTSIKQQHAIFGDINYDKRKLQQEINLVCLPTYIPIDLAKEGLNLQQIKEVQKPNVNHVINFVNVYYSELFGIAKLLSQPLIDSNKIAELLSNAYINEWVKKGYEIHAEDRTCECKFCGNSIEESRWKQLDNHFDEESKKLESSLIHFKEKIEREIDNVANYKLANKDLFYINFQDEVIECSISFNSSILKYKNDLEFLLSKINERLIAIHIPIEYNYNFTFSEPELKNLINFYEDIQLRNNDYSNEISGKIVEAKKELRLLEIKRFVETIQYGNQTQNIDAKDLEYKTKEVEKKHLVDYIKTKEKEINELYRQLNNEEVGARRVNEYLQSYFGHQNLELQAIEEEVNSNKKIRFNIIRNGDIAYHLSEGECSIISFCYFMAKLDDIHTAGQKPIILIDDPISSLDSNHIFYIYSLLNTELFINNRFEQIFISTHNLEFLKYLKRLKLTKNQNEYFIINRYEEFSTITLMPKYLKDYVTEFNFLFEQIYKCAKADIITDQNHHIYYNFGNNARKFLEALLFYKYPSRIDNQTNNANTKRLLKYFGGDQQATALTDRVNNELSHLEEIFDRGMNPIEIPELKRVAQFILDKIKKNDNEQYDALLESIGIGIEITS